MFSIEPTTPVLSPLASQWRERPSSSNGDHNSSETEGAPLVGRHSRTTRTTHSDYVRTTLLFEAYSLSQLLVASVSRQLVTWTTPQWRCPRLTHQGHTPRLGFWSHQFPASWSHGPLRSRTAQAPPIRLDRSALSRHVALNVSASCQHKPQDRPWT